MKGGRVKPHFKYNPITSTGEVLLQGRHPCNCEARKHVLINNCLNCGRIVCEQERSGPCFTCGQLVCSPKEQQQISRMSKAGCKLYNKLMNQSNDGESVKEDSSLQSALSHRDKLLEYDQTVERRTKVIDDQNDYFLIDSSWLSSKERAILSKKKEELKEAMHGRKKNLVTFDYADGKFIEEEPCTPSVEDVEKLLKSDLSIFECQEWRDIVPEGFSPTYEDNIPKLSLSDVHGNNNSPKKLIRIQDRDLQEMSDEGVCLSLHQPYASLLVAGIKTHEGRDWYTNHRGRLWIHSANKIPTTREISDVEKFYKYHLGANCKFPSSYPTGCLLGCVDVVECLPQEEYKIQFPYGEIASPYVFICENAQELNYKFPMKGKCKIFKLESNIHQASKKILGKR